MKVKFSELISTFCEMVDEAKKDYEWNTEEVKRLEKLTQDYLHKLELEPLTYSERAKLATQMKECRILRRKSKDTVEVLSPFVDLIESERGVQMMNFMREVLGQTRKIERAMEIREYRYRVLQDPSIVT